MAGQGEAGDVRRTPHSMLQGEPAGHVVQPLHLLQGRLQPCLVELVHLEGVDQHAGAQRLGEDQAVPCPSAGVGEQPLRICQADDREAVLELLVPHRMTAEQHGARLRQGLRAALQDAAQGGCALRPQLGKTAEVEGEERPAAHGVDVRQRVGGGHPAEAAGIVAHRSDEVGGGDQGVAVEQEDPGVVARFRTDEDPLIPSGEPDERSDHR